MDADAAEKRMRLRYAGACSRCGAALDKGAWAHYDRTSKTVRCDICPASTASQGAHPAVEPAVDLPTQSPTTPADPNNIDIGTAGASARREWERRHRAREERVRARAPRLGGILLKIFDDPSHTTVWQTGAVGEEKVGSSIQQCAGPLCLALHDRALPRSRANIDHIAVTGLGVWVIDTKRYVDQRPARETVGGLFSPRRELLRVGGRDRTTLVEGVERQVALVREALPDQAVPVTGVLAFVDADWPLLGKPFTVRDVVVTHPRGLRALLRSPGAWTAEQVAATHLALGRAFPPA